LKKVLDNHPSPSYSPVPKDSEEHMSGAKASKEEKDKIRQLFKDGYSIADVQARMPHIDGRVISGMHKKLVDTDQIAPPPKGPTTQAAGADSQGVKSPQIEEAEKLGLTPEKEIPHLPSGFRPTYREYFVVKKLDPPNDGIQKTEYPPFGISELMDRYPPGDYEIQHYREGKLYGTYRDRIAAKGSSKAQVVQESREQTPTDIFIKAIDSYHRIHHEARREAEVSKSQTETAQTARETAKADVEKTAITSLVDVVKEQARPRKTEGDGTVDKMILVMQEERKTTELRHTQQLETMEKRFEQEMQRERERLSSEMNRFEKDLTHRENMQKEFLGQMQKLNTDHLGEQRKLENERQKTWKESVDRSSSEIGSMQTAIEKELAARKDHLDELAELQRKHLDELAELRKLTGGADKDIEVAKVVRDGVVAGLDRVGHRIDMLAGDGAPADGRQIGKISARQPRREAAPKRVAKEEKSVPMKDRIKDAINEEWFQDLQDEITRTIKKRLQAENPRIKPHGSMLGQSFLDKMNEDAGVRTYFHYLCSREWKEILDDASEGIKEENKEALVSEEAGIWFNEFQSFLIAAWNHSIGVA